MLTRDDSELGVLRDATDIGAAFARIFESFRPRLERAVGLRMDFRLRGRMDPGDVVQEAYIECARRLEKYLEEPPAPLFLWVRYIVLQRLLQIHRRDIVRKGRDVGREVPMFHGYPGASSYMIAAELIDSHTSPTQAAARAEAQLLIKKVLDDMNEIDREILVLRHFEQMTSSEAAHILGIEQDAARKRYLRALKRLRVIFDKMDDLLP